ncbi:hypothetical protein GCM10009818_31530 [Nakamurella flavida]
MQAPPRRPSGDLSPALLALFDRIRVEPDRSSARVDGHLVEADDPHELRKKLSGSVYEILHAGRNPAEPDPPYHARDTAFEADLLGAVPHTHRTLHLPVLADDGDTIVVLRDGVRVRMLRDATAGAPVRVGDPVTVHVPPARPLLSPGFFFVDGTRTPPPAGSLLRVYLHLPEPTGALQVWRLLLPLLEESGVGYRAKILSAPRLYPRRDALVVYLDGAATHRVDDLVDLLDGDTRLAAATPAFATRVAPGISIAWEPADPRREYQGLSFGQHRAHVLVDTLLDALESGSPLDVVAARKFAESNIDPTDPARNADTD